MCPSLTYSVSGVNASLILGGDDVPFPSPLLPSLPIDVPTNQNIGGDTSPASPAGLTPMYSVHQCPGAIPGFIWRYGEKGPTSGLKPPGMKQALGPNMEATEAATTWFRVRKDGSKSVAEWIDHIRSAMRVGAAEADCMGPGVCGYRDVWTADSSPCGRWSAEFFFDPRTDSESLVNEHVQTPTGANPKY